jgi:hypothetical protein
MAALRLLLLLSAIGGIALLVVLWRAAPETAPQAPTTHEPAPTIAPPGLQPEIVEVVDAEPDERTAAGAAEPGAGASPRLPLVLRLDAPAEWLAGIDVAVVWRHDPATHRGLQATLRTDRDGVARAEVALGDVKPELFWADLAFPTLGLVGRPIPPDGGEVTLAMVMPAWLEVAVVEADGEATVEDAVVEVRAVAARAPADRWHRLECTNGRARTMVEAGLELEVSVRTASGRTAVATAAVPQEPELATPCRLQLVGAHGCRVRLLLPDGTPAAASRVAVADAATMAPLLGGRATTDGDGRLRLWPPAAPGGGVDLHLRLGVVRTGQHFLADLSLPGAAAAAMVDLGDCWLRPLPPLLGGDVVDPAGRPRAKVEVTLEAQLTNPSGKGAAEPIWRPVATATTDDAGRFVVHAAVPPAAPLRVWVRETRQPEPTAVRAGQFDARVTAAPVRRGFLRRF